MADKESTDWGKSDPSKTNRIPQKPYTGPGWRVPSFLQGQPGWGTAKGIKASRPGGNAHDFGKSVARSQADAWNESRTGRPRYPKGNSDLDPGFNMPNNDASNDANFYKPNNDASNDKGFYRGPDDDDDGYDDRL